jgi:hypothetical protein
MANLEYDKDVQIQIQRAYYKIVALESELRSYLQNLLKTRILVCTLYYILYVTTIVLRIYKLIQKEYMYFYIYKI